jgi:hypothetical protein
MTKERDLDFLNTWRQVLREHTAAKDGQGAIPHIAAIYKALSNAKRDLADARISELVLSDDTQDRFAALALITEFQIRRALPELRELASRLRSRLRTRRNPDARFYLEWVERAIKQLIEASTTATG